MSVVLDTEILDCCSAMSSRVAASAVCAKAHRLDASAFLGRAAHVTDVPVQSQQVLADIADVFTVYIQTPILYYVTPFENSRPYLTTSELGQYQQDVPAHVSLLTDPRLIDWEIARNTVVLSRSGRVGEAYWVDKKLAGALVGDSFRIVARSTEDSCFLYALLASKYARDYVRGVTYGSVVDHASVEQVRTLPVPSMPQRLRERIAELVQEAVQTREAAYDLLDAADISTLRANDLPDIQEGRPPASSALGQPECFSVPVHSVCASRVGGSEHRLDAHFYNPVAQLAIANIKNCREVKTVGDVTKTVFFCNRFTRTFVEREHGVPYLAGKDIIQIRPTELAYLSKAETSDLDQYRLQRGWTLMTCSGTIGRTCMVWKNYEEYVATHDLIRIVPDETQIDGGYLYALLSSDYGKQQVLRYRHGSVIDHVTPEQVQRVLVSLPPREEQTAIGDKVRQAYDKRAEAIRLEDEAQAILMEELTSAPGTKGV
jgi:type I restriction enzyme S subunit